MNCQMKRLDYSLKIILLGAATVWVPRVLGSPIVDHGQKYGDGVPANQHLFAVSQESPSAKSENTNDGSSQIHVGSTGIDLPDGGVIWVSEDPMFGHPELSVSAPTLVGYDGHSFTQPVDFYVRSNYAAFVKRYEILIFEQSDVDLVTPIKVIPVTVDNISHTQWDGQRSSANRANLGDQFRYIIRAIDQDGNQDETKPKTLQLVKPEEIDRSNDYRRRSLEQSLGRALSAEDAISKNLINDLFTNNGLLKQTIPLYGSRVRIQGRNISGGRLMINHQDYPVDIHNKFVAEYLLPIGQHTFQVDLSPQQNQQLANEINLNQSDLHYQLDVDVSGHYFFGMGLVDLTLSKSLSSRSVEMKNPEKKESDLTKEGRFAFYTKAKFRGKYLLTAQADSHEKELKNIFRNWSQSRAVDVFRSLDPDYYYPTYGDDSFIHRDIDTQGNFYLRLDWDKNQALWGNFNTGFTGTEYSQYVRSLYGAAFHWQTRSSTKLGDAKTQLKVFGSQPNSVSGHDVFLGTGGSLYYLHSTGVINGSDQVILEVWDRQTQRIQNRINLVRGIDYDIDQIQGRIILTRPLMQISRENYPRLTRDTPLEGFEHRIVVDYEYVPTFFETHKLTTGIRAKQWLGNHVAIGGTYVREGRESNKNYTLKGADLTLQLGKGSYLRLEESQTDSLATTTYYSQNGGFDFSKINPRSNQRGRAQMVEARANLYELGWTQSQWILEGWYHRLDDAFSTHYYTPGRRLNQVGVNFSGNINSSVAIFGQASRLVRGDDRLIQGQISSQWTINDSNTLSAELRRIQEEQRTARSIGLLAGLRYDKRINPSWDIYGSGQLTLSDDHGRYPKNNAATLGTQYFFGNYSSIGGEYTHGSRGDAQVVSADYKVSSGHDFYGRFQTMQRSVADQQSFTDPIENGWTLGQRWRLSNQVNIFNESQYLKPDFQNYSGLAHTFGLDFYPQIGWVTGLTLQKGDLTGSTGGYVHRRAASVSLGRSSPRTDYYSRVEWRRDRGSEQRKQWVTTNRLQHRLNDSWRVAGRINYSYTTDQLNSKANARFLENNIGFSWRPWNSSDWGMFFRYTYLYDIGPVVQSGNYNYNQKTQVFSWEGVHRWSAPWESAVKLAHRLGQVRYTRQTGRWLDSNANFVAAQMRYELIYRWHILGEYRYLRVKKSGSRRGWLVGVDRDLSDHLRLGVGYNFTHFSDDLSDYDFNKKGVFVNILGSY